MSVAVVTSVAALLGAFAGALTPRAAYRMATASGVPFRVACQRCARPFRPGLAGWLRPGSRCPGCALRFGPPLAATATGGAVVFAGLAVALGVDPALPAFLAVAAFGLVRGAVDLACLRLPDPLVGAAALLGGIGLAGAGLALADPGRLLGALAGALVSAASYLLLAVSPGSRLGFGDVKLGTVLGLLLGWLGWRAVLLGLALPHLLNGAVVLVLLLTGRVHRNTALPLGPALLAGAWLAVLLA